MRSGLLALCAVVALAAGGATYFGGSAAVQKADAATLDVPFQFAETYRDGDYRGVGADLLFDRSGVTIGSLRQRFVGAKATPVPSRPTGTRVSYFTGPKNAWKTGLSGYSRLTYENLWPGVDLAFDGTRSQLKYTLTLAPGADPAQVRLAWSKTPRLLADGSLRIGGARDEAPVAWQTIAGKRVAVPAAYALTGSTVGFRLGSYDRSRPLTLDPSLVYAGFIGGAQPDDAAGIAVDSSGAAYVAGFTLSNSTSDGFPAAGPQPGAKDAYLAKVLPDGSGFQYVTYIGGTGFEGASGVAVDGSGRAYVVGTTSSDQSTFPVLGGPDTTANGADDAFVTVVDASGTGLVYSTFVGSVGTDHGNAIAVDSSGNAYITGETSSALFPSGVSGATFDSTYDGGVFDAYVVKIHAGGTGFDYAGYIGGDDAEMGKGIAVDGAGAAYVTGSTLTTDSTFQAVGGPQGSSAGAQDAFVAKIDPSGSSVAYRGFLGGNGTDGGLGIAVDSAGNAYVAGQTYSGNFPVVVGPSNLPPSNASDGFVTKIHPTGTILYSGYLHGTDAATAIAVDAGGSAYVVGVTTELALFPAAGGPDSSFNGQSDGFALQIRPNPALPLGYATYIGGGGQEAATGVALDATGAAYVSGITFGGSPDMPSLVGPDLTYNGVPGQTDGFVEKIGPSAFPPPSTNADLSALTTTAGPLAPAFSSGVTSYDAGSTSAASVTVTPTSADSNATIRLRLNGGGYFVTPSGVASSVLPLAQGLNTIDVQVTAQDGLTVKTYTITVTGVSSNANLSALTISAGLLAPAFSPAVTSYNAGLVANATSSTTVTPTAAQINATIQVRVNGGAFSPVTSGSPSGALALVEGPNTIDVKVTAQDLTTTKTYSITITRASSNANLSALTISAGTLAPAFSSGVTSYDAGPVPSSTVSVTVTPTAAAAGATIQVRINGGGYSGVTSGSPSGALTLQNGTNTIEVRVTAQDAATVKTYSITLFRASGNANLSALTISAGTLAPAFAPGTTSYTDSVPNATASVKVTPTAANANATIQVRVNGGAFAAVASATQSGALALAVGANTVDVKVTAQDLVTTKTYTITVTRALPPCGAVVTKDCASTGVTFTKLTINGGNVTLTNVTIGKLTVSKAKSLTFTNVHVTGAAVIQFTTNASSICGSAFDAALTIAANAGPFTIGDPGGGCPANMFKSLTDNASTGAVRVIGNTVTMTITLNGNKSIDVESNTAGKLGCLQNKSVTGFGNVAPKKTGQCAGL